MITLQQLSMRYLAEYRTVRLWALQDTPSAFGSTFARESALSDEDWRRRVESWNGKRSICYLAMENDAACGIIAGRFEEDFPERAYVLSMWVAPIQRRSGLGTKLMGAVQVWAIRLEARELGLMVTSSNAAAISFYERCGFARTGVTEPYQNDPALLEYEMVKPLRTWRKQQEAGWTPAS